MSDFFQGVTGDLNSMEEKVLGPQYNYAKNTKNDTYKFLTCYSFIY